MQPPILSVVTACNADDGAADVCMGIADAFSLRAVGDRRVVVEVRGPATVHHFDLEDVCVHGRPSEDKQCWCVPADKAMRWTERDRW